VKRLRAGVAPPPHTASARRPNPGLPHTDPKRSAIGREAAWFVVSYPFVPSARVTWQNAAAPASPRPCSSFRPVIAALSGLHSHTDLSTTYSVTQMSISNRNVIIKMNSMQCRMARTALQLTTVELAALAVVAPSTIARLEAGERLQPRTVEAIRAALEKAGIEFIDEDGGGPGVRLRRAKRRAK
jgi:hypothetical protein